MQSDFANADVEYAYNANGAMTKDLNKGIANISYNLLNLPQQVDILSPLAEARNAYSYSAGGVKLRVVKKYNSNFNTSPVIGSAVNVSSMDVTKTTDYVAGKIFENGTLDRIFVDGGYIQDGVYYFYETDHLGSNRITVSQAGAASDRSDYFPYGMQMAHNDPDKGMAMARDDGYAKTSFKFSGKELDVMHGLNLYDFSARSHDPAVGRFTTVDPMAEKYYNISRYAYCAGNPVNAVDPTGMRTYNVARGDSTYQETIDDGVEETEDIDYDDFYQLQNTYSSDDMTAYNKFFDRLGLGTEGYAAALLARKYGYNDDLGGRYAEDVQNGAFPKGSPKCNQFVYDIYKAVGAINNYPAGSPPQAGDYANPNYVVNANLNVVDATSNSVHLGDLIAGAHNFRDASGHAEIVVGIYPNGGFTTAGTHTVGGVSMSSTGQQLLETKTITVQYNNGTQKVYHYDPVTVRRPK